MWSQHQLRASEVTVDQFRVRLKRRQRLEEEKKEEDKKEEEGPSARDSHRSLPHFCREHTNTFTDS